MNFIFYKVNPGGNITALVPGSFTRRQKIDIAKTVLESDGAIEQVGFWTRPKNKKAIARLEMAGGEFCGNAVRSLAYLVWEKNKLPNEFFIESSGTDESVNVAVGIDYAEISLPLKNFSLVEKEKGQLISIPGICHLITNKDIGKKGAKRVLKENGLLNKKAAGVISVKRVGSDIFIKAIVWVRDTETLYEETACASGTLAVGYLLNRSMGRNTFCITQPSKSKFIVTVRKNTISLGGPIIEMKEKFIEVQSIIREDL